MADSNIMRVRAVLQQIVDCGIHTSVKFNFNAVFVMGDCPIKKIIKVTVQTNDIHMHVMKYL